MSRRAHVTAFEVTCKLWGGIVLDEAGVLSAALARRPANPCAVTALQ